MDSKASSFSLILQILSMVQIQSIDSNTILLDFHLFCLGPYINPNNKGL